MEHDRTQAVLVHLHELKGRPLETVEAIVNLIGGTRNSAGLRFTRRNTSETCFYGLVVPVTEALVLRYHATVPAVFLSRPNRFIAYVLLDGEEVRVHVKNTGRCREILIPGTEVFLVPSENPSRSTPYDLVAVVKGDRIINIDSQAPNKVAYESIGAILGRCDYVKPEYTLGDSRFDFYAESEGRRILMEVKGVTLEDHDEVSFPDAPTARGTKHVTELTGLVSEGYRCVVCFIIQMEGVKELHPNSEHDPDFSRALRKAASSGVEVLAFECTTGPGTLELGRPVPVKLD